MKTKFFIGTSGWYYDWNKEKTLDWYIENSNFNVIELNASFYRFPFPNHIKGWGKNKNKNKKYSNPSVIIDRIRIKKYIKD